MFAPTTPLGRAVVRLLSLLPAGTILSVMLASGCEDTLVPAVEEARLSPGARAGEGGRDGAQDECLLGMLYRVEGELLSLRGGSAMTIDLENAGGGGVGGGGTGGGSSGSLRAPGLVQELYGYDGFARLLWDDEVVAEFTIDKAFLESGRVEVLAYETPDGAHFEYRLYTQPDCSDPWPGHEALTRQEVEALED